MDQSTVLDALARLGSTRRFFAPEHADLVWIGRETFYRTMCVAPTIPWFDLGAMQSPLDHMAYMECILTRRPRVVVETGTASGAGALFYAEVLRRVHGDDKFRVITVELVKPQISYDLSKCPQIVSLIGSSVDPAVVERVYGLSKGLGPVMVTLDSDHDARHVAREMGAYSDLVSVGQYMIVQDTFFGLFWGGNLDGEQQKALREGRGGDLKYDYIGCPLGAVEAFLSCDDRFRVDMHPQRWIITQCPFGFLLRER